MSSVVSPDVSVAHDKHRNEYIAHVLVANKDVTPHVNAVCYGVGDSVAEAMDRLNTRLRELSVLTNPEEEQYP